jgi:hypothetical protein
MAEEKDFKIGGNGLVQAKTQQGALDAMRKEVGVPAKKLVDNTLSSFVMAVFRENEDYKKSEGIEDLLLDNLRRRIGEYSPQKLQDIARQGGSAIYAEITGVKCRNAESWLSDVFSPDDEKAWSLQSTPIQELPGDALEEVNLVAQAYAMEKVQSALQGGQAVQPQQLTELTKKTEDLLSTFVKDKMQALSEKRVRNMERLMYDQLLEAEWDKTLDEFIFDITTFKSAIMKGPVIRNRKTRRWDIKADGTSELLVELAPMPVFERVNPLDFYPAPLAKDAQGPGPMIEKLWLTRAAIEDMKDHPSYDSEAIERVLEKFPMNVNQNPDNSNDEERLDLENKGETTSAKIGADTLYGLEFHGSVSGSMLLNYGVKVDNDRKQLRSTKEYHAEIIMVGMEILYVSLNPDKLERHPYSSTSWTKIAGAFWGESVPELLTPVQDVCNASLRALVNNMAFASGPQVSINDLDRVPDGEDLTEVYPLKIWQWNNERNMTSDPIKFFAIPSNANELYSIYENFKKQADDDSGIPAYAYGNERTAGAGRTASGLSMLMTGASRGIKKVIRNIHREVIRPSLERLYDWNMVYVDDKDIKGDADIIAVGAVAVLTREQTATRRMELLQSTNNPTDLKLMGLKNRAELWRQTMDTLEFDGDKLILTEDEISEIVQQDQANEQRMVQATEQQAQSEVQAKMQELQIKQQEADQDYDIELKKLDEEAKSTDINAIQSSAQLEIQAAAAEKEPAKKEPAKKKDAK